MFCPVSMLQGRKINIMQIRCAFAALEFCVHTSSRVCSVVLIRPPIKNENVSDTKIYECFLYSNEANEATDKFP